MTYPVYGKRKTQFILKTIIQKAIIRERKTAFIFTSLVGSFN